MNKILLQLLNILCVLVLSIYSLFFDQILMNPQLNFRYVSSFSYLSFLHILFYISMIFFYIKYAKMLISRNFLKSKYLLKIKKIILYFLLISLGHFLYKDIEYYFISMILSIFIVPFYIRDYEKTK